MPTRRDRRRFGPGPYLLGLSGGGDGESFPFSVPAVSDVARLRLDAPVTLLAGDNGTGKSTLVEALAEAIGFAPEGGELERAGELPAVPRPILDGALEPVLSHTKPRIGYFLRAESFFNVARSVDENPGLLAAHGGQALHEMSHGESFLQLVNERFYPDGLFVLDEPEAALSPTGLLGLLRRMKALTLEGGQFLVATHSPILLAYPGALIYELRPEGPVPTPYEDTDHYRLTRAFLEAPDRFLRSLFA
jgi:predicted ATPase